MCTELAFLQSVCAVFHPSLLLFFFLGLKSFILVWHSDYEFSNKTQKPFFILKESNKCHNINYRVKIML